MAYAEQIANGIFRISVTLPGSPLGTLNSFFIEGIDEDYLVDTGFNLPQCEEDLTAGLKYVGADRSRLSIINTHLHTDHSGQNHKFLAEGHRIYQSEEEIKYISFMRTEGKALRGARNKLEGASEEFLAELSKTNPGTIYRSKDMFDCFSPIKKDSIIETKYHDIQWIVVPGHTAGNSMLWIEKEGIMLTGDHILFDITPNITCWPGCTDILGEYIESLRYSKSFPVKYAYPGHRKPDNYHKRIDALLKHHDERLNEVFGIIANSEKPLNAFEITKQMKWHVHLNPDGSMPAAQLQFAAGECLAHIDHLICEGKIKRNEPPNTATFRTYSLR